MREFVLAIVVRDRRVAGVHKLPTRLVALPQFDLDTLQQLFTDIESQIQIVVHKDASGNRNWPGDLHGTAHRCGTTVWIAIGRGALVRWNIQSERLVGRTKIVLENRVQLRRFIVGRVERRIQKRILELLSRSDHVQPIVENFQVDDIAKNFVNVQRELQSITGAKV